MIDEKKPTWHIYKVVSANLTVDPSARLLSEQNILTFSIEDAKDWINELGDQGGEYAVIQVFKNN